METIEYRLVTSCHSCPFLKWTLTGACCFFDKNGTDEGVMYRRIENVHPEEDTKPEWCKLEQTAIIYRRE